VNFAQIRTAFAAVTFVSVLLPGCGEGGPVAIDALSNNGPELPTEARPTTDEAESVDGTKLNCPDDSEVDANDSLEQWCVKGGFKHGPYMTWFENGNRKESGNYNEGKFDGLWTEWFENGGTHVSGFYKAGRKHGSWTTYFEVGNTRNKGDYLNGREVGIWTFYHLNGNRSEEGTYVNGIKDGEWRTWEEDGTPADLTLWRSGKEVEQ
jgi:hypothetical protein